MKSPHQLTTPTACKYLDSIQHLANTLRNAPASWWEPTDISLLHEVDSLLSELVVCFQEIAAAPNPDDYEPEN